MNIDTEKFLTVEQIAALYGISKHSIRIWAKTGKLKAHKVGRRWFISLSDQAVKQLQHNGQ